MEAYIARIRQESLTEFGLQPRAKASSYSSDPIIEGSIALDLHNWWSWLTTEAFDQALRRNGAISLRLVEIENSVPMDVFTMIGGYGSSLTELVIENCASFTWAKEMKAILRQCAKLQSLRLIGLKWVDDGVVEQLSVRYQKSLRHLELNRCSITNNALFHLGRRCSALKSLHIICCNKVTDAGILEMTKNIHLDNIHFAHSLSVTDKSMAALLGMAADLTSLQLINLPKLTDATLSALYETGAAWGKKRSTAGTTLRQVILQDNANFTAQVLLWLSTSAVKVESIELRDLQGLNVVKGLSELYNLTSLQHLSIGPCVNPIDGYAFNSYLVCHADHLVSLHLTGLAGMEDEQLGELLDQMINLHTLTIEDMPFGTSMTEALCSNIPNIAHLSLINSQRFGDPELRCISVACLHLKSLTLSKCNAVTDAGFVRFIGLKMLSKLHLPWCSTQCSGNIVKGFSVCPLTELVLDGFQINAKESFSYLRKETRMNLTKISLQQARGVTVEGVRYLVEHFVGMTSLDLTLCHRLSIDHLTALSHFNPFLTYSFTSDFSGFHLDASHRRLYVQYTSIFTQLRRHYAARLMQRLRRRYLRRLEQLAEFRKDVWKDTKAYWVSRIQALYRGFVVRRAVRRKLLAGRRLVRAGKDYLFYRQYLKGYRAKMHYRRQLKRKLFGILFRYHTRLLQKMHHALQIIVTEGNKRLQRRYFKRMLQSREIFKELKFEYSALAFWEVTYLSKVLRYWRTVIFQTSHRKQLLAAQFLQCLPISTWNSERQLHHLALADNFRNQRLRIIAWIALANDRLEKKRVDSLEPMAIEHFQRTFFHRVCGLIAKTWSEYAKNRIYKREKKAYGEKMCRLLFMRKGCVHWDLYTLRKRKEKELVRKGAEHFTKYTLRLLFFTRMLPFVRNHVVLKRIGKRVVNYVRQRTTVQGYVQFKKGVVRSRIWRVMQKRADNAYRKHYFRFTFAAWNQFRIHCHNLEAFYVQRYLARLKKRAWRAFKEGIQISKEFAKQLALEIERKAANEAAYLAAINSLRLFQARIRGIVTRRRFQEARIQKLYSIQVLQNFFRTYLARKEYASRLKKREIAGRVREDKECELMKEEEVQMLYYLYHVNAAVAIQRVYRGRLDRKVYFVLAVEYYRQKNLEFYEVNHKTRMHHQAYLRAAYLREQQRHMAATEIERIARGKLCRIRYVQIKRHALMVKKSVIVQRWYRTRLAKLKLLALRRDMYNELRFREARDRRGFVFRLFGIRKRKAQNFVGGLLKEIGLDPISFNHRVSELWEDTKRDFEDFVTVIKRERMLFKEHGFNRLNRMLDRRKMLNEKGWKLMTQQAVKIVEPGHPFEGYTGVIVRIDESVQGNPLYEVSLDKFNRQTFVRMTTDPLKMYETVQPLGKIANYPPLPPIRHKHIVFGLSPNDPFFDKNHVTAAWKIQSAFRMHRARRMVARKRYEHWMQNIARQTVLLETLSESNALNTQGYNVASVLKVRSLKPIRFDEIRHRLYPARLLNAVTKVSETAVIDKELDYRFKDRQKYLQKSTLLQIKEFFAVGHERFQPTRKMSMFLSRMYGLFYRGRNSAGDVSGGRGTKYLSGKKTLVAGMDRYQFKQFESSPHVRYFKMQLYQGEWAGVPLVTPLHPHGEGIVVFLDGWGFAKEDKVLYLTIVACRHLNPMDLATGAADPYCEIRCNGVTLQTSIKWSNLNPQYHENFEIDVTNPSAKLQIIVKDKDYFGSDDFMGQIELKLADFADGRSYHATYQLKGEDLTIQDDDFDRGELEIRLRWAERKHDDDYHRQEIKKVMLVKIQTWARCLAAQSLAVRLRAERKTNLEIAHRAAIKITSSVRMRLAQREFRRRLRQRRAAIKIQKRVRIWIAKKIYKSLKIRSAKAIIIQTRMRVCLAKAYIIRLKAQIAADLNATVTVIQKYVRRYLAKRLCTRLRLNNNIMKDMDEPSLAHTSSTELAEKEGVSSWLPYYGVDPEYGLKRNRRITQRLFRRMMQLKYTRLVTRFGIVYMDSYPPRKSEEEILDELAEVEAGGTKKEELTVRDDFVSVFIPPFDVVRVHRKEAIDRIAKNEHTGVLHIPTAVNMRASVHNTVATIQCVVRQRRARAEYQKMLRVHRGIALFQRIFRKRFEAIHRCAVVITSLFHRIKAIQRTNHVRRERRAAVIIQCSFRCYRARSMMFDFRSVSRLAVLKSSPESEPGHGPEKCLEHRDDTFWIAKSNEKAEIRVEFGQSENVTEIWIMTSTYSASPNYVSIGAVLEKKSGYTELVDRQELPLLKERRWHKFIIPVITTKYFMFIFYSNYGDEENISVRQIRFVRSRESSATIVKQPVNYILNPGPTVAEKAEIILRITATGWPLPTFQWYHNNKPIEGATGTELRLSLFCPIHGNRVYRCIRCKMVSKSVPLNAYHIQCGNCSYQFTYKEIEDFDKTIHNIKEEEEVLARSKSSLQASMVQMESIANTKYGALLNDAKSRLKELEDKLQILREERVKLKQQVHHVNQFTDEGVYTCEVINIRGGSLRIKRKSVGAVVLIERPKPYVVEVVPMYVPRMHHVRKKWTIYSSILGTFRRGKLEGLCRIRYNDGSFYEGPYIGEDSIDQFGHTISEARKANHFGIFKTSDGRTFEGHNVDNHFDANNLQTYYRVRLPNKEIYEGMFVDETYHGVGVYTYSDGSVYEGQWHRGTRFGHGQLRSSEGWTYEGFFDTNRRHRKGIIDYPDGSTYLGDWYYDRITGRGIYITALKDVYRGELLDGKFHGQGQLIYADGSIYTGEFRSGFRHGRGIFIEREGTEYYGHFREDFYHGEMVVKLLIAIEEDNQDNYEIRIGVYDMGKLVKWKSKFSNPIATKQFITLFRENRDMFDSVYSMLLAKHLPHLPEGIDANNKKVKSIVFRIRLEAGMLVGEEAFNQAKQRIESILAPFNAKKAEIEDLQRQIERISSEMINTEKESHHLWGKFSHYIGRYEKNTSKVEQFWQDDPKQTRVNFIHACRLLYTISTDEYFAFRNYRAVPVFVKKIVDAISFLLSQPDEWREQQMLLADSASNGRSGDEEALRLNYHCKLAFYMTYGTHKQENVPSGNAALTSTALPPATGSAGGEGEAGSQGAATHGGANSATHAGGATAAGKETGAGKGHGPAAGATTAASLDPHDKDKENDPGLLKPLTAKKLRYYDDIPESKMGWGFNIFQCLKLKEPQRLAEILADTRFRSDSYYIESTGVAGPVLVNWVKATNAYANAARDFDALMKLAEEDRAAAYRYRAQYVKKQDELQELTAELGRLKGLLDRANDERVELEHALVKAQDLLQFIAGRYQFESQENKRDYYKLLEEKLEQKRDFFTVEVCLQSVIDQVVEKREKEKHYKRLQAFGAGQPYVDDDEINQQPVSIVQWLLEEVLAQQKSILDSGRSLGYSFEAEANAVTKEYTLQLISLIVDIVIGKLNDKYNDLAAAKSWISRKGRRVTSRFLYIFAWKIWEEEAIAHRNRLAIHAWEEIWGDVSVCARMAIEARVNQRMSSIARKQAKVWADSHKQDIAYAESDLAAEFLANYGDVKEAAYEALMIERETSSPEGHPPAVYDESIYTPLLRAQTLCFCKLYPEAMQQARDAFFIEYANAFTEQFGLEAGMVAYQLLNGLPTPNGDDDLVYMESAQHWRDFNLDVYEAAGLALRKEMSEEFIELYPMNTALEAAKFVVHLKMNPYLVDETVKTEFTPNPKHVHLAYSYGMLHQGLLRQGKENLLKDYEQQVNRMWQEIDGQTLSFQKGSALLVSSPEEDRFVGFRNRLTSKYALVYGYLCYEYDELTSEIGKLQYVDPIEKVIHRVRPSEMKTTLYEREHVFLQKKYTLEDKLKEVVAKLTQWNSYFGWVQQEQLPYQENRQE